MLCFNRKQMELIGAFASEDLMETRCKLALMRDLATDEKVAELICETCGMLGSQVLPEDWECIYEAIQSDLEEMKRYE